MFSNNDSISMHSRFLLAPARRFAALTVAILAVLTTGSSFYSACADEPATDTTAIKAPTPPKVGEIAPDFELKAIDGTKIKLSEQTAKGPVVLIELRGYPGYQCPFCTAQVGKLVEKANDFAKANARVVLVYPGPAEGLQAHADEFVRGKDTPINFFLLLDPDFTVTKQYGLRWDAPHETSYPSTFVMDTKSKILFAKISHEHGDRSTPEEILAVLPK